MRSGSYFAIFIHRIEKCLAGCFINWNWNPWKMDTFHVHSILRYVLRVGTYITITLESIKCWHGYTYLRTHVPLPVDIYHYLIILDTVFHTHLSNSFKNFVNFPQAGSLFFLIDRGMKISTLKTCVCQTRTYNTHIRILQLWCLCARKQIDIYLIMQTSYLVTGLKIP